MVDDLVEDIINIANGDLIIDNNDFVSNQGNILRDDIFDLICKRYGSDNEERTENLMCEVQYEYDYNEDLFVQYKDKIISIAQDIRFLHDEIILDKYKKSLFKS